MALVRLVPALALSLPAGAAVDGNDRRKILMLAGVAPMFTALVILAAMAAGTVSLSLMWVLTLMVEASTAFDFPCFRASGEAAPCGADPGK